MLSPPLGSLLIVDHHIPDLSLLLACLEPHGCGRFQLERDDQDRASYVEMAGKLDLCPSCKHASTFSDLEISESIRRTGNENFTISGEGAVGGAGKLANQPLPFGVCFARGLAGGSIHRFGMCLVIDKPYSLYAVVFGLRESRFVIMKCVIHMHILCIV